MRRLTVHRTDGLEVCVLEQVEAEITIVRCTDRIRPDLERWIARGVTRLIGPPAESRPIKVKPGDPKLLDAIASLMSDFGFLPSP